MKTIIFSVVSLALGVLTSVKGQNVSNQVKQVNQATVDQTTFSTAAIVESYLKIKNALVKSDGKTAAQAAAVLESVLNDNTSGQLIAAQQTVMPRFLLEARKQVTFIMSHTGKLDQQRKAFQQLSKNINELVATFGTPLKLYQDFCPMYEGGSIWLSETKDIKNPYYGAQMLTCGKLKETIEKTL